MTATSDLAASIEKIDLELQDGFELLRFAPDIERQYVLETAAIRVRHLVWTGLAGVVLYDLFLGTDFEMVPDVFREAVILRVGVYTPLALLATVIVARSSSTAVREGLAALVSVVAVIPMLWLFANSTSPDRFSYHYGTLLIMMFITIVQRVQFGYAVAALCVIMLAQFITVARSSLFDAAMVRSEILFYLTSALLFLFAAYTQAREQRRSYLLVARGELLNRQLDHITRIDPLTGLWNRRQLNTMMEAAWGAAENRRQRMAVILIDIDHFKMFNDTYGHVEGDICLQRIGARLRAALGGVDQTAVRFGGEEFLVFFSGAGLAEGERAARTLWQAIHDEAVPFPAMGETAIVTVSIGVAAALPSETTPVDLIAAADAALYDAKRGGRNRIVTGAEVAA